VRRHDWEMFRSGMKTEQLEVGRGFSYRAVCVDVRTWSLNVGEENVEQIGDCLMIRSGLAFRDREPFDVCRRGSPRGGLFNCLVDGSG
jgi:hypothetical protein